LRLSGVLALDWFARAYVFVFRGTPLLVQIFLIYYGLGQFPRCGTAGAVAVSARTLLVRGPGADLNTAAYASEIIRGGLQSVPFGQIEAARACGMSRLHALPPHHLAARDPPGAARLRQRDDPMVKATSLASIITMMEVTGVAAKSSPRPTGPSRSSSSPA
jgi:octopine/nopaline transport system permease protein